MSLGNFLSSLAHPEITRQIPFVLKYIYYDWIKDDIARMEYADYNTVIIKNVMDYDIEYFSVF